MFNKDFYPTPDSVADLMEIDCFGKVVYEPSAGSGNLIRYMKNRGASKVLASEKDSRLCAIARQACDDWMGNDFLAVVKEQVSHIDQIIMNPPFSCAADHILHAWEIAPEGCEITSLCNHESLDGYTYGKYRELSAVIKDYGYYRNLGSVFSNGAERTTGAEIALVKLYKPVVGDKARFEGFYMEDEVESGEYGIMTFSEVRRIVGVYKASVERVGAIFQAGREVQSFAGEFGMGAVSVSMGHEDAAINEKSFAIKLQKLAWKQLFAKINMKKYVTTQVMEDINRFCENQSNVPFTVRNIRKMMEIIIGTREQTFQRSLVEAIDNYTKHTRENRYNVEGWATNSGYMLNRKFIINRIVDPSDRAPGAIKIDYYGRAGNLEDLTKVLCWLTGKDYNEIPDLWNFFRDGGVNRADTTRFDPKASYKKGDKVTDYNGDIYECLGDVSQADTDRDNPRRSGKWQRCSIIRSTWYEWGFFRFKGFYKGTLHLEFLDKKLWEVVNRRYAEAKGQVLPEQL